MSKTIKVIDLLNKIANGEEVPKKIKCRDFEYIYSEEIRWYRRIDDIGTFDEWFISANRLNNLVEIIEEQQDIDIQKIEELDKEWTYVEGLVEKTWSVAELEIIENLNKLASAVKQLDKNIKDKE